MRIGIDFDNTIVSYDALFHALATRRGLIPADFPADKTAIRDHLRHAGREDAWTRLQGQAYGQHILDAAPFEGAIDAIRGLIGRGVELFIISHKTQYPYRGQRTDLHAAAWRWLEHHGVVTPNLAALPPGHVFFEPTKADKLARIAALRCDWFVDDLPEFLAEPDFPPDAAPVLFDPADRHPFAPFQRITQWPQLGQVVKQGACL